MIADVLSYAIAGIGFIHAVGRSFVRKGAQHEHCYNARLPQSSAPLALRFARFTDCLRLAMKFSQRERGPCWTRLKRLESSGAIQRYVAILDHKAIGLANIVFVEVTLNKHDDKVLEEFGAALARIPEVVEAHLVTGDYDYLVKVAVAATEHYENFLRESLYRIPGIQHSRSTFALRAIKETVSVDPLLLR